MRFINIEFYSILFPPSYLHVTLVQNILLEFTLLSTSTTQQTNPTLIDDNISFQQFHVTFLHNHLYFSPLLSSLTLFSTPLRLTSFLSFSLSFLLFSFLFFPFDLRFPLLSTVSFSIISSTPLPHISLQHCTCGSPFRRKELCSDDENSRERTPRHEEKGECVHKQPSACT